MKQSIKKKVIQTVSLLTAFMLVGGTCYMLGATTVPEVSSISAEQFNSDNEYVLGDFTFTYTEFEDYVQIDTIGRYSANSNVFTLPDSIGGKSVKKVLLTNLEGIYNFTNIKEINIPEGIDFRQPLDNSCSYDLFTKQIKGSAWYNAQSDGFVCISDIMVDYKGDIAEESTIEIPENIKTIVGSSELFNKLQTCNEVKVPATVDTILYYFCPYDKIAFENLENIEYLTGGAFADRGMHLKEVNNILIGQASSSDKEVAAYVSKDIKLICRSVYMTYDWKDTYIYNPECEIQYRAFEPDYQGTIHGYKGSTAEAYALRNGFNFEEITDEQPDVSDTDILLKGDVDGDGEITSADALKILQYVVGIK